MASALGTLTGTPGFTGAHLGCIGGTPRPTVVMLLSGVLHLVGVLVGCSSWQEYSLSTQASNLCRAQPHTRENVC